MEGEKTDDLQPVSVEITEHEEEAGGLHPPPSPPPPGVGNESDGAGASKREELQEGEGPIDEAPCVIADGEDEVLILPPSPDDPFIHRPP